jgi:hypothetical protein
MKITPHSLLSVITHEVYRKFNIEQTEHFKMLDITHASAYDEKIAFFKETNFRKLVMSKTAMNDVVTNYKVPNELNYKVLRTLPNRKDLIMIDDRHAIRYIKDDKSIFICYDSDEIHLNNYITRTMKIHLDTENIVGDCANSENVEEAEKATKNMYLLFILLVTYLELTDIKTEIVLPNQSVGTKKTFKVKNESNASFILVKGNWNTEKIILKDFSVKGHWRLQPYGIGRTQYKYIFIEPFEKGISRRLAQKQLV